MLKNIGGLSSLPLPVTFPSRARKVCVGLTTLPRKNYHVNETISNSHTSNSNRPVGVHETRTVGTDAQFTENMNGER